ncbi:MAG: ATP phosphoribosyltransferase regulatory subunit, partial [Blautia sp.]|nr:ATP phosphoribosyltransferase regulatory subunit [Blautia sp.]
MQRIFHTPEGVRDTVGAECLVKREVEDRLHEVFASHGFMDIETPTFEYFEVFSNEVGTIASRELYKFFDRNNDTLVLRPDFTPSVARACATYFHPDEEVVSLCYAGKAFINHPGYQGRLKEATQMGVERMGEDSAECDAELLAMTVECLLAAGLSQFQVSIGFVEYFKALLLEAGLPREDWAPLRELISQKNFFGVEELVRERGLTGPAAEAISRLPEMFGGVEILEKAKENQTSPRVLAAVERLEEIYRLLCIYGVEKYV